MNNNNKITDIYREGLGAEYLNTQSFQLFFQTGTSSIER